eukprot:364833-Chlamydomonas_euryale.AAC.28
MGLLPSKFSGLGLRFLGSSVLGPDPSCAVNASRCTGGQDCRQAVLCRGLCVFGHTHKLPAR